MRIRPLYAFALLAACGGGGAKYKVDDVALAQIPVAEKQAIFAAQNDISVAKSEQAKAIADADAVDHDLDIADKEADQAKLETQKAKIEADAAEKSRDLNRTNAAQKELRVAEIGEKAASAKYDWLGRKKKWHRALADLAEEHVHVAESKVELEKARLAAAKGIKPSDDFKLDNFAADYANKVKRYDEARKDTDKLKGEVDKLGDTYNQLKAQYAQMRAPQPGSGPNGVAPTAPASYSVSPSNQPTAPAPAAQ